MRPCALLLFACAVSSCSTTPVLCSPSNRLALAIRPEHSGTGASIASQAVGTVHSGTYSDSLQHGPSPYVGPDSLVGGYQAGTYSVHIEATGFVPFDSNGIRVRLSSGECPVLLTQHFTARLAVIP